VVINKERGVYYLKHSSKVLLPSYRRNINYIKAQYEETLSFKIP
jgi:hypothetical protein